MNGKFRVKIIGSMYCFELFDDNGDYVTDLDTAIRIAEELYGDEWSEVWNGIDAAERTPA